MMDSEAFTDNDYDRYAKAVTIGMNKNANISNALVACSLS
jgi:hypothetical protein